MKGTEECSYKETMFGETMKLESGSTEFRGTHIEYHYVIFFNVAPCMLPHLLYNPTHALFTL
jgi:hypothetical protein